MDKNCGNEVVTASGLKNNSDIWTIGPADRAMAPHLIRGVWIFRKRLDAQLLKKHLSDLLVFYPYLNGRIKNMRYVGICNDGIPFTVCHLPDMSIETVKYDRTITDRFVTPINKRKMKTGQDSLLSVRITYCADGCVLGVLGAHLVMDGASFYRFVNNWAALTRGESIIPPVIKALPYEKITTSRKEFVQAAVTKGFRHLSLKDVTFMMRVLLQFSKYNERVGPFFLSNNAINRLKKNVFSEKGFDCTTNEVLSAFVVKQCIRQFGHTGNVSCGVLHAIDVRRRIPDIPELFCGNASYLAVNSDRFNADASLGEMTASIRSTLTPFLSIPSPELEEIMTLGMNVADKKIMVFPGDFAAMFGKRPRVFYINNQLRLPVYEVDFGTGIADTVIPHNLPDPVVFWPAAPDPGGVEVYLTGMIAQHIKEKSPDSDWLEHPATEH